MFDLLDIKQAEDSAEEDRGTRGVLQCPEVFPTYTEGETMADVDNQLLAFLLKRGGDPAWKIAYQNIRVLNVPEDHRWLLVSALQKAIRRGHSNLALLYANTLYHLDKSYLKYRLGIIAIEDVGVGALQTSHAWYVGSANAGTLNSVGGKEFVLWVVDMLAKAPKCRATDDVKTLISMVPESGENLSTEIKNFSGYSGPSEDVVATTRVVGAAYDQMQEKDRHTFTKWFSDGLTARKIPAAVRSVAIRASKINREKQWQSYPFWFRIAKQGFTGVRNKPHLPVDLVGPYLSPAIDNHTREGKIALAIFAKSIGLSGAGGTKVNMGRLLFRMEGHVVNNRAVYPGSMELAQSVVDLVYAEAGAPAVALMRQAFPQLNSIRRHRLQ